MKNSLAAYVNHALMDSNCLHFTSFFVRFHKIDFYLGHMRRQERERSKKWFLFLGKLMVIIYFGYLGVKFTFWIKISLDWVTQNDTTILSFSLTLFRNKRFMLDEMLKQNAPKFAILLEYENLSRFFISFHAMYFIFPLMNALLYVNMD